MLGRRCRLRNRSTLRLGLSQEPNVLAGQGAVAHTTVRELLIPWTKDRGPFNFARTITSMFDQFSGYRPRCPEEEGEGAQGTLLHSK